MNRALVVGCAGYEDADIAPLRYAHRDAARVAEVMRAACGVEEANLIVMHNDMPDLHRPTRTNLLRQLTRMSKSQQDDGIIYFFFSGHGFQAEDNEQYLLPIDCVRDAIEETALPFTALVRHLGAAASPHVVMFLDACRNVVAGGKAADSSLTRVDIAALCPPGVVSFCSCKPGTVSYESETIESGIFTEALCRALDAEGRCRTIYELDTYLSINVPLLARANGKPEQAAHSRVEPLGVQYLEIVSERTRNEWQAATPIGSERRTRRVPLSVPGSSVANPLVGVDFGTSYSIVSWSRPNGDVLLLPGPDGRPLVPSVVHFLPNMDYLVGTAAVEAEPYNPAATIRHVKRVLGTSRSYNINGRSVDTELATSLILRSLRRNAEEALGTPVSRCIASHPANFTLRQIKELEGAFSRAGFEVYRMIGEPNVAAYLTLLTEENSDDISCLVVDLGGGTFDVALVEAGEGVAEIKSTYGSNSVGGLDYDVAIVAYAERQLREKHGWTGELTVQLGEELRREAERAKRDLGRREVTTLLLQDVEDGARGLIDISIELDRARFREITAALNADIRSTIATAFRREAFGVKIPNWLKAGGFVLLAGQGTKIFTVREQVESVLPGVRTIAGYQETAVAQGLGMQAGVLTGTTRDILLLNALQFGLGYRILRHGKTIAIDTQRKEADENVIAMLRPSTTIPTRRSETLPSLEPGKSYEIELVEIPLSSKLVFGRIPLVPDTGETELTVDVDNGSNVVIEIKDLGSGKLSRCALDQL